MSEVVKANVPQTVLLQQLAEIGGNASGVEDIAHGIHKNIAVILFAVAISAYAPILLLLLPQHQQLFPDVADQRQGAQAGFRLGTVGADDFTFAVYLCVGYLVTMCLMVMVSRSKSMASHFSPSASLRRRP